MPGMIACFRNNGERRIRIVGMDMNEEPSNRYLVDAFYTVPAATDPVYCDRVLDICKKEGVQIYFPNISAEVSAIVKRQDEFERLGVMLSLSNQESVNISNNKLHTYLRLQEAKSRYPSFIRFIL